MDRILIQFLEVSISFVKIVENRNLRLIAIKVSIDPTPTVIVTVSEISLKLGYT